ncbi:MAG: hypothetical protein JKY37_22140 [Nannocystaceae bacterium]|nr:hypothetical protein [Nannocystaceae bacterium]
MRLSWLGGGSVVTAARRGGGDGPDKSDAHVPSELGDAEDNDDEASANFSPERGRQRGGDAWSMRPDAGDGEIADAGIA